MSNTEKALNKLNPKQREYIEIIKSNYNAYKQEHNTRILLEESIKSISFLTGLEFAGVITNREKMLIHVYVTL